MGQRHSGHAGLMAVGLARVLIRNSALAITG